MLSQNPDRKILVAWLITVGLITTRELHSETPLGMPRPSAYTGSAVVFGIAAILAELAPELAVMAAAGWTLAIAYQSVSAVSQAKAPNVTGQPVKGTTKPATTGGR